MDAQQPGPSGPAGQRTSNRLAVSSSSSRSSCSRTLDSRSHSSSFSFSSWGTRWAAVSPSGALGPDTGATRPHARVILGEGALSLPLLL